MIPFVTAWTNLENPSHWISRKIHRKSFGRSCWSVEEKGQKDCCIHSIILISLCTHTLTTDDTNWPLITHTEHWSHTLTTDDTHRPLITHTDHWSHTLTTVHTHWPLITQITDHTHWSFIRLLDINKTLVIQFLRGREKIAKRSENIPKRSKCHAP